MLSRDPVIQWCLEEALSKRLVDERHRDASRREAHLVAQARAQAALAKAAG